jgi:hypothetical protein
VKQKSKKRNKVVDYLDGDGAFPATEKDLKKWIKKFLTAEDKNAKGKGSKHSGCPRGYVMIPYMKRNLLMIAWLMAGSVWGQEADGYYGIFNANSALIDSISNESGTLTGDFSTQSLLGPVEHAQWATDGPVVVSTSGEVLGTLSTVETNTHSIFNETIYVQIPYTDRCEACIGSLNDNFSTVGPKIYDSQSSELKDKIGEVIGAPLQENP